MSSDSRDSQYSLQLRRTRHNGASTWTSKVSPDILEGQTQYRLATPSVAAEVAGEKLTKFGELATELRTKIWVFTIRPPRTIRVEVRLPDGLNLCGSINEAVEDLARPPAILHVSRESREVGLRFYSLANTRPTIYLQKNDILYLDPELSGSDLRSFFHFFEDHPDNLQVQNIAFCEQRLSSDLDEYYDTYIARGQDKDTRVSSMPFSIVFPNLKKIILARAAQRCFECSHDPAKHNLEISLVESTAELSRRHEKDTTLDFALSKFEERQTRKFGEFAFEAAVMEYHCSHSRTT